MQINLASHPHRHSYQFKLIGKYTLLGIVAGGLILFGWQLHLTHQLNVINHQIASCNQQLDSTEQTTASASEQQLQSQLKPRYMLTEKINDLIKLLATRLTLTKLSISEHQTYLEGWTHSISALNQLAVQLEGKPFSLKKEITADQSYHFCLTWKNHVHD